MSGRLTDQQLAEMRERSESSDYSTEGVVRTALDRRALLAHIDDMLAPAELNRPGIDRAAQAIQAAFGKRGVTNPPTLGAKLRARQIVNAYFEGAAASLDPLNHAGRPAEVATTGQYIPNKGASDVV